MSRQSLEHEDFTETKSVLEEEASIYQKREEKTEKEKWKDMDSREKRRYFMDYYFIKIVIGIIAVAGIAYFAYSMLKPKMPVAFYMAYIYGKIDDEGGAQVREDFAEFSGINLEEEDIVISDQFYTDETNGLSAKEKIMALSYTQQLDIVVAEEENFEELASNGNMVNLKDYLGEELYREIEADIYKCSYSEMFLDGRTDENEYPFGFYVKGKEAYKAIGCTELKRPVMGIIASSQHKEMNIKFIRYMLGEE